MRKIGSKYQISGELTTVDGTPIPDDEPLLLFRAQDQLLPELLEHYLELSRSAGAPQAHLDDLQQRIDEVRAWQAEHSTKVPD